MRTRGSGTIVNVSSIGGEIALPLGAWYYASKHAMEAFSDSLRQEVGRFGIRVVLMAIREAIDSPSPKARYVVGYLGKMLLMLNRVLPDRAWDRMVTGRLG